MNAKQINKRLAEIESEAVAAKAIEAIASAVSISDTVNGHRVCCIISESRTTIRQEWMVDGRKVLKHDVARLVA